MRKGPMIPQWRRQRERPKSKKLSRQDINSARVALFYFFGVTARRLRLENTHNVSLIWRTWTSDKKFFFLFLNLDIAVRNSTLEEIASGVTCILQIEQVGMIAIIKRTRIHSRGTLPIIFSLFRCTFLFVNSKYGSGVLPVRSLVKNS